MKKDQAEKFEKELDNLRLDYLSNEYPELSGLIDRCYLCLLNVNKEAFETLPVYKEHLKEFNESYDKLQEYLSKLNDL